MIVVDSSAAVAALLGHQGAREALSSGRRLVAPHLIDAEVAHALRGLARGARLSEADARAALAAWGRLAIDRLPMVALIPRAWELRDNLTVDDALFVAAAETVGVPLVTADRRLVSAPGIRCRVELVAA